MAAPNANERPSRISDVVPRGHHASADPWSQVAEAALRALGVEGDFSVAVTPNEVDDDRGELSFMVRVRRVTYDTVPPAPLPARVLQVGHDSASFALAGEEPVRLHRRPILARLFAALLEHHRLHPDRALSRAALIEVGWPGDKCARASLSNRLHFALATLRSLGLRSVLMRREDGYLIDPSVTIHER